MGFKQSEAPNPSLGQRQQYFLLHPRQVAGADRPQLPVIGHPPPHLIVLRKLQGLLDGAVKMGAADVAQPLGFNNGVGARMQVQVEVRMSQEQRHRQVGGNQAEQAQSRASGTL